jgi:hypothetical protein
MLTLPPESQSNKPPSEKSPSVETSTLERKPNYLLAFVMLVGASVTLTIVKELAKANGIYLCAIPIVLIVGPWIIAMSWFSKPRRIANREQLESRLPEDELLKRLEGVAINPRLSAATRQEARERLNALRASSWSNAQPSARTDIASTED